MNEVNKRIEKVKGTNTMKDNQSEFWENFTAGMKCGG